MIGSVGVIFGETGSHEFKFAVSDPAGVRRTDYVKVWHATDGWVLGQVLSMTRSSDGFGLAEAISEGTGHSVQKNADRIVAKAIVIGARDTQGLLRTPKTPFCPGDRVYPADSELIIGTLGLTQGGAYLGFLDGTDLKVMVDRNKLVQKHCSILAMTGSGKSYTAAVIMEEMLEKEIPLLIIDPHGEYGSLKQPNDDCEIEDLSARFGIEAGGYDNVTIYTPANLKINDYADKVLRLNGRNLKPGEIIDYMGGDLSASEIGLIYEAVGEIRNDRMSYTLADILREVGSMKSNMKWSVINKLEPLVAAEFLADRPTPLEELFARGRAAIIDMKGVNPEVQQVIVARLLSMLFEARKAGTVPAGIIVVEEAHNFCPEKGFLKTTSSDVLRTIASEGRKFGMGLLIVSQRPAKVDKNVLSQCSTQVIMRVTNPNDLKAITKSLEGISSELEEEIKRLPPGVALLVNPDIPMPVMVQVRVRRTRHGGLSAEVSEDEAPLIEAPLIEAPPIEAPIIEKLIIEQKPVAAPVEELPKKGITESLFHKMFGRR